MSNPFEILETRLNNIESLLLDLKHAPQAAPKPTETDPEPLIFGITGLATFLGVSLPTAQKIKNSGKIPYSQTERTIIFNKAEVLASLSNQKRKGKA